MREEVEAPVVANTDIRSGTLSVRIASRFWWLVLGFLVAGTMDMVTRMATWLHLSLGVPQIPRNAAHGITGGNWFPPFFFHTQLSYHGKFYAYAKFPDIWLLQVWFLSCGIL